MDLGAKEKTNTILKHFDFEALFKRNFTRKITSPEIEKVSDRQITVAALMQPLQYFLQDPAAKDNSITHAAAAPSNLEAIHYNAFCSITSQTCTYLRTWQRQMTTIMQPFQCDLRPQIQETQRTTRTGATTCCRTQEEPKRAQPQPPRTRGTFHRWLQPLYTEKHKVSCSGSPQHRACNIHSYSLYCYVMSISHNSLTTVSQHPSLSIFLCDCDVKSHTAASHQPSLSIFLCDVRSQSVFLCDVKSHTTISHHPSLSVFLCDVKSHTALH